MKGANLDKQPQKKPVDRLLTLLSKAEEPFDEECVKMDCNDGCEEIATLAERVAQGEKLEVILPNYAEHMEQIGCCKEEFDALVSVFEAEAEILQEIDAALADEDDNSDT